VSHLAYYNGGFALLLPSVKKMVSDFHFENLVGFPLVKSTKVQPLLKTVSGSFHPQLPARLDVTF
jgi:hypothetical protein